jgi:nucleoside-diphosphate-sugar epimerase
VDVKVVSCLSSAMLPEGSGVEEPATEALVSVGSSEPPRKRPPKHVAGYAASKHELLSLSDWLSHEVEGLCAVNVMPSNIFGPHRDPRHRTCGKDGPLVNALLAKAQQAKNSNANASAAEPPSLVVLGTGKPRRQVLFSGDLARILVWALEGYRDTQEPLMVAGSEHSVLELASAAARTVGFTGPVTHDLTARDGPLRRVMSISKLESLYGPFPWTPLDDAMRSTAGACGSLGGGRVAAEVDAAGASAGAGAGGGGAEKPFGVQDADLFETTFHLSHAEGLPPVTRLALRGRSDLLGSYTQTLCYAFAVSDLSTHLRTYAWVERAKAVCRRGGQSAPEYSAPDSRPFTIAWFAPPPPPSLSLCAAY